jgi:hypothetical protein
MSATLTAPSGAKLHVSHRIESRLNRGELTSAQVDDFRHFLTEVEAKLLSHRIIHHNPYCDWFATGQANDAQLKFFLQQFSVFSNQFLIAALLRVINAPALEQARAAKEILLNELGVIYRKVEAGSNGHAHGLSDDDKDREGDPDLVGTEGTVDGGTFRFRAAHFEWLLRIGEHLGLGFNDLGQRRHGRPSTLFFCDELQRTYGSADAMFAEGASFAVENWAAAGFWQQLEDGLTLIKKQRHPKLPLAFFTWHNRVEGQHASHTLEELEEVYFDDGFDKEKFFRGGQEILAAVAAFWDGLEADRHAAN